jgi:prepilin-type processing-associated H-X9-DG protein
MCTHKHSIEPRARESDSQSRNPRAFTLIELLAVVVTFFTLAGMALLLMNSGRGCKAPRIKCVNNLKNVGLAFRIYATDNNDRFPWEISNPPLAPDIKYLADPSDYIRGLSNELSTPKIVVCPEDKREEATNWIQFSRTNLSYWVCPDASEEFPQSFLAGDRNITNKLGKLRPGLRGISTNHAIGWDETIHKNQGNACMGDGSVQQLSGARLRNQLLNTGQTNKYIKLSVP